MRDIVAVQPGDEHALRLTFEDGEQREVDIRSIAAFDGVLAPLADQAFFRQVRVNPDLGTIVWPNVADLCPNVLYAQSRPVAG